MNGYSPLLDTDDVKRVVDALTRASLKRRGKLDQLARLDDPTATVRVELDDEDAVRVHLDGELINVVPRVALEHATGLLRMSRKHTN